MPYETLLSKEKLDVLQFNLKQCLPLPGYVAEAGVYRGGSASFILDILKTQKEEKSLLCFDTFTGIPDAMPSKDKHKNGDFNKTSLEYVREKLSKVSNNFVLVEGLIPDTFQGHEDKTFCFVHIDTDTYTSYMACLDFFYKRTNGIILFDDYLHPNCPGAKEAVDLFFKDLPEDVVVLKTLQALVDLRK